MFAGALHEPPPGTTSVTEEDDLHYCVACRAGVNEVINKGVYQQLRNHCQVFKVGEQVQSSRLPGFYVAPRAFLQPVADSLVRTLAIGLYTASLSFLTRLLGWNRH
jgi:hypothetical protein